MLESKIRTPEEIKRYMLDLKKWLAQERSKPVEEMSDFHWTEEYAHIADYFDTPLSSLLDIGCGTGLELASIYRKFPNVQITGIDLSKEMMSKLKEKYSDKNIDLILADYFEYPFEQEKYDAALSFETLHHFKYQKKQKIYKKLFQTIKPGGYYVECDLYCLLFRGRNNLS